MLGYTSKESNSGAVDTTKTVRAGCGIRYGPDVLGEDSGFDFSPAKGLKAELPASRFK